MCREDRGSPTFQEKRVGQVDRSDDSRHPWFLSWFFLGLYLCEVRGHAIAVVSVLVHICLGLWCLPSCPPKDIPR